MKVKTRRKEIIQAIEFAAIFFGDLEWTFVLFAVCRHPGYSMDRPSRSLVFVWRWWSTCVCYRLQFEDQMVR